MATVNWAAAADGIFQDPLQWTGGVAPAPTDTAVLGALGGAAYTVVSKSGVLGLALGGVETVNAIQTAKNATLEVVGDIDALDLLSGDTTFAATSGTGGGVNAGTIVVQDAVLAIKVLGVNHLLGATATLKIGGNFDNTGAVSINGQPHLVGLLDADQTANLEIAGATTLTGHGHVTLSDQKNNHIFGAGSTAVLNNVNNTISGAGDINRLSLNNGAGGVIDATAVNDLIVSARGTLQNAGLLEASSHGKLFLARDKVANTGTIEALTGSAVHLLSTDVMGGVVKTVGNGLVVIERTNNEFDGSGSAVTVAGNVRMRAGSSLTLDGAIHNTGRIGLASLASRPVITDLIIGADGVTLDGGGKIVTTKDAKNHIVGATGAANLTNVDNSILAAGELGGGKMTLINETKGRIVALYNVGLTIDTGANVVVNAGIIDSRGAGGLVIKSAVDNTGLMEATSNMTVEGAVTGTGAAKLRGATLHFADAFTENVAFLKGPGAVTSGTLELSQSVGYGGTISAFSKTGGTFLDLDDIAFGGKTTATYAGTAPGGILTVTDGVHTAQIHLSGNYLGTTFTVVSDGHGGTKVSDTTTAAAKLVTAMSQMPTPSALGISAASHPSMMAPLFAAPSLHAA